jgi:hypothetical protein
MTLLGIVVCGLALDYLTLYEPMLSVIRLGAKVDVGYVISALDQVLKGLAHLWIQVLKKGPGCGRILAQKCWAMCAGDRA